MDEIDRFPKPNMATLEGEWGRKIIEQILNTPRTDREELKRRADAVLKENELAEKDE